MTKNNLQFILLFADDFENDLYKKIFECAIGAECAWRDHYGEQKEYCRHVVGRNERICNEENIYAR